MKRLLLLILGALLPSSVLAASIFDPAWDSANDALDREYVPPEIITFVIDEATKWNGRGIELTEDDIRAALRGDEASLCEGKKDMEGSDYIFAKGSIADDRGTCGALIRDILEVIHAELAAQELGADLQAIAASAELATADEPRPFLDLGSSLRGLKRVWVASGGIVLPWDEDADEAFDELNRALSSAEEEGTLEEIVYRFHHGFFRDSRENDPRFGPAGDEVESALSFLSGMLNIDPNAKEIHEITVPSLDNTEIRLWARTDDLGLLWTSPVSFFRIGIRPAGAYPVLPEYGAALAYPFSYEGGHRPDEDERSPLCSRAIGRYGFLCRPLPTLADDCEDPESDEITLVACDSGSGSVTVSQTELSCTELSPLFLDDGTDLFDPDNPGSLNPNLKRAGSGTVCHPGAEVQYPAGILSHLCYSQACLAETLSGHSIIPRRNPVLSYQATDPILACIRPDPQLGFYMESSGAASVAPPPYRGPEHVAEFFQDYCQEHGNAPHPLAGYCLPQDNIRAATPTIRPDIHTIRVATEADALRVAQQRIASIATSIGLRFSVDQMVLDRPKVMAPIAAFVDHVANLFLELRRAPLTTAACPITGPVPEYAPVTP